jgi:hypothetical protein
VVPSTAGTPLSYANVYNRVLRPALIKAGIAVQAGTVTVRRRGKDVEVPVWDYQRVATHAFRHACGTLLHGMGKRPAQAQAWLRHSQLTTTMNIYTHLDDEGMGGAEGFDQVLGAGTAWDLEAPEQEADDTSVGSTSGPPRVHRTTEDSRKSDSR